jgi:hypothetical protein
MLKGPSRRATRIKSRQHGLDNDQIMLNPSLRPDRMVHEPQLGCLNLPTGHVA